MVIWRDEVRRRLVGFDIQPERMAEIVEELALHLDDRVHDLLSAGQSRDEAVRTARAELERMDVAALLRYTKPSRSEAQPGIEPAKAGWWRGLGADLRYGVRSLRRQPGIAALALAILALGIGGNAGIFSVVNAVLLQPLPFVAPDRLVSFWGTAPEMGLPVVNYPDALYSHYRERSRSLAALAMHTGASFTLTGKGDARRLVARNVTSEFFRVLGVRPLLGRDFTVDEAKRGQNLVTILSHGLWQQHFGGDPAILGRSITLNDIPTTVVGVMPRGFDFPDHAQLWVPLGIDETSTDCWCYEAVGRLRPGVTTDDVAREVDGLNEAFFDEQEPGRVKRAKRADQRFTIVLPLSQDLVGPLRDPVLLLLAAVGAVLLVACANLANLLLVRAIGRQREFAIRVCLGGSPGRIVRQLLLESTLLAFGGGLLGLAVATWVSRFLGRFALERLPHLQGVAIDGRVLLFTAGTAALSVLLFGLAPALRSRRLDLQAALRDGSRASLGSAKRRLSDRFVVVQVAFAVVLLVTAGLLVRSFGNLMRQDAGFDPESTVVARVLAAGVGYQSGESVRHLFQNLETRLRAQPQLTRVALSSTAPFSRGNHQRLYFVEGKQVRPGEPGLVTSLRSVTPTYFSTLGTTILQGRAFTDQDRADRELVAIVDEGLARTEWPQGNALGKRIRFANSPDEPWRTIVGVSRSILHGDLAKAPDRYVYVPFAQYPQQRMDVLVRSAAEPAAVASLLRGELAAIDPAIPIYDLHTMTDALGESVAVPRLLYRLVLTFALAALLLAAIGLYGVLVLNVTQRSREFGVRLALGASPAGLRRMVMREGLLLAALGIGAGILGAAATTSSLRATLFGVQPQDPLTFVGVVFVLAGVVLIACYLPARRATSGDPLRALRQ